MCSVAVVIGADLGVISGPLGGKLLCQLINPDPFHWIEALKVKDALEWSVLKEQQVERNFVHFQEPQGCPYNLGVKGC